MYAHLMIKKLLLTGELHCTHNLQSCIIYRGLWTKKVKTRRLHRKSPTLLYKNSSWTPRASSLSLTIVTKGQIFPVPVFFGVVPWRWHVVFPFKIYKYFLLVSYKSQVSGCGCSSYTYWTRRNFVTVGTCLHPWSAVRPAGCTPATLDSTCTVPVYKLLCNCK